MKTHKIKAPAKINLGLEILFKRIDNFHEINSVFYKINLFDEIEIIENKQFSISIKPYIEIPMKDNLVYKAVKIFQKTFDINKIDFKINLTKNIPLGSGLGGGSTDAASTLLVLTEYYNIKPDKKKLIEISSKLGSDVPFFLSELPAALVSGRGELIDEFNFKLPYYILIIYPNLHISTKWAYENFRINSEIKEKTDLKQLILNNDFEKIKRNFNNDFEKSVFQKYPELSHIKEQLYNHGSIYSSMTGSGSCIYGLFQTHNQAIKAQKSFQKLPTFLIDS